MLKDSLDVQAPIKTKNKNKKSSVKLSELARLKIAERDTAHQMYKKSGNIEDLRLVKNL